MLCDYHYYFVNAARHLCLPISLSDEKSTDFREGINVGRWTDGRMVTTY